LFNNAVKSSVLVFGSKWNEVYCKLAVSAYYLTKQFYTNTRRVINAQQQFLSHIFYLFFSFLKHQISDQELSNAKVCGLEPKTKKRTITERSLKRCFQDVNISSHTTGCPSGVMPLTPLLQCFLTTSDSTSCYEWNLHNFFLNCLYTCIIILMKVHKHLLKFSKGLKKIKQFVCSPFQVMASFNHNHMHVTICIHKVTTCKYCFKLIVLMHHGQF